MIDFDCLCKAAWTPFVGNAKIGLKLMVPQNEAKIPSVRQPNAVYNADLIKQRFMLNLKNRSWPRSTWQDKGRRQSQSCSNIKRHCNLQLPLSFGHWEECPENRF